LKNFVVAVSFWLMLAGAGPSSHQPATPVVGPDLIVNGAVNGHPTRFQMRLGGEKWLYLNPDAAVRLGLKPGMFSRVRGRIGNEKFKGAARSGAYLIDGVPKSGGIVWFQRRVAQGVDGGISPGSVPHDVVTVRLREIRGGEQVFSLPMVSMPGGGRFGTMKMIGGQETSVIWDLARPNTLVTAAAAADLSSANGGRFVGEKRPEMIEFEVERPVRPLVLATPFAVGPVLLSNVNAWVGDYGDTSRIPDANADPSEIVVTAMGAKVKPLRTIVIGRNDMARCSSITFDKSLRQIRMSCAV
jgi:hypothetical protein